MFNIQDGEEVTLDMLKAMARGNATTGWDQRLSYPEVIDAQDAYEENVIHTAQEWGASADEVRQAVREYTKEWSVMYAGDATTKRNLKSVVKDGVEVIDAVMMMIHNRREEAIHVLFGDADDSYKDEWRARDIGKFWSNLDLSNRHRLVKLSIQTYYCELLDRKTR